MINDKNKDTWCVNANHAMSGMNNGTTKICCMHSPEEQDMVLGVQPITQHFNKKEIRKIRKALNNGEKHPGCRLCWEEETSGRKSKRMRDNEHYLHEVKWKEREPYQGLAKVELNLGNTCNISCRTCTASISSGWMKEEFELYKKDEHETYKDYAQTMKKYHMSYDDDSPFWNDIESHLPTIKQFDFYGGEPFMIKKHWNLLQKAVDLGYASEIELHYNTNGTHWPKEIKLWKNFKKVNLSFSIDGIGDQFEYMRYPAKWETVKRNIENAIEFQKTHNNMSISWCVTISTLNVFNVPEIVDYVVKNYNSIGIYLNLVHIPKEYNVKNIPDRVKPMVVEKLNTIPKENNKARSWLDGIISFIQSSKQDILAWEHFLYRTKLHDEYRNQSFKDTFPEYAKILEF